MPAVYAPALVLAYFPDLGLSGTVSVGNLGGGGGATPETPLTRIVTTMQSGYYEYVVAANDGKNKTWNISFINEVQSDGMQSGHSTGLYNTFNGQYGSVWNTIYYKGSSAIPTTDAIPIDIIAHPTPQSSTIYTYDCSGLIYSCVGFSSSAVWTNITPSSLTGSSIVPVTTNIYYAASGQVSFFTQGSPLYMSFQANGGSNTLAFDSSGYLYALYYRVVPGGVALNVQKWTGVGTSWIDTTSGNALFESNAFSSSTPMGVSFGAFSSVSGSIIISSPTLKTTGSTSGTQLAMYMPITATSGMWENYLTTYAGYGFATALNTSGNQEEYTLQSSAINGISLVKFSIATSVYSGTVITSAAVGDIYNIGGVSSEPTNQIIITAWDNNLY